MVDCEGGFGFTESAEGEVYFHRNSMVEGEFDAIEPGSRRPPRGPRARERGGLAGNHGPPHWQASSAGETRLIRLRELCPATPDFVTVAWAGQYPQLLHHQRGHNFFGSARARRGQQPLAQEWRNPRASAASSGGGERVRHWRHGGGRSPVVKPSPVGFSRTYKLRWF